MIESGGRGTARLSDDGVRALVQGLVRAPFARRWRLDREVRQSAAHLAIAEGLAAEATPDEPAFQGIVERRYASELRSEARRRLRHREREVSLHVGGDIQCGYGGASPTPEALVAVAEVAALVQQRARALTGRRRAGRRAGAADGRRGCGAGAASAGVAPSASPSEATRRRWRAQERNAIRRAAREVMGR